MENLLATAIAAGVAYFVFREKPERVDFTNGDFKVVYPPGSKAPKADVYKEVLAKKELRLKGRKASVK